MRRAMRKPCEIPFKYFAGRITELNNYPPLFTAYSASKKIPPGELNKILLHTVPNGREKQAYLQGWDFDTKSYKATCNMCEKMEIAEKIRSWNNF